MTKKRIEWINTLLIFGGLLCCKVAYNCFRVPNRITGGGFAGIGQLVNHFTNLPIGFCVLVLNVPLFITTSLILGKKFSIKSFVVMALYSATIDILPLPPLTVDPFLATFYGGLFSGLGFGLILRARASTGGSDMLAALVNHYIPALSIGTLIFAVDAAIIAASMFVFNMDIALYSIIAALIENVIVDAILAWPSGGGLFAGSQMKTPYIP